jgi:aspartyl-tRNA(Asn)/glutamyl-tRNA(Gln) amidotransferase subunit B
MPSLPEESLNRMMSYSGLKEEEALVLLIHPSYVTLFFACLSHLEKIFNEELPQPLGKLVSNWISGEVFASQKKDKKGFKNEIQVHDEENMGCDLNHLPDPIKLAELLACVLREEISHLSAKKVFTELSSVESVQEIIKRLKVEQITDHTQLYEIALQVIDKNPVQVEQYLGKDSFGKEKLFEFFIGKAMALSQGKAHPEKIRECIHSVFNKK